MPADNTYNRNQEQEDIRRYLSGEMSASEMHALEKAALDDPFLADAIEGMSFRNVGLLKSDTDELRRRLVEKSNPEPLRLRRIVMWRRIAIAASVLALAIISTVLLVNRAPDKEIIAQVEKKEDSLLNNSVSTAQPDSLQERSSAVTAAKDSQLLTSAEKKGSTAGRNTVNALKKDAGPVAIAKAEEITVSNDEASAQLDETARKTPAPVMMKSAGQELRTVNGYLNVDDATKNKSANANLYFYTGQVTDAGLQPISFANISIKNSNHLTYTDARGYFRLLSADSTLNVDVKSVGFNSNSTVLSYRQPQHQLILSPLPAKQKKKFSVKPNLSSRDSLNEGDSLFIAEDSAFVSTDPEAEPVDGWGPYHLYLLNNVRPQKNPDNRISDGTVVVSFLVNPNGWLTEFKIEKSLNSSCDREAIRLIREGPKWELYNSDKALRTKVTVSF